VKILIYNPYSLDNNSAPMMLDEALEYLRDPQSEVVFVTCRGELKPCLTNAEQSRIRCMECMFSTNLLLRGRAHPRLHHESLTTFMDSELSARIANHKFAYDSLAALKKVEWEGVNIGLSVVSTFVSMTRNLNPALNQTTRRFLDDSLRAEATLVALAARMFARHEPDLVCLFNGRFVGLRGILEAAQIRGIRTKVLEYTFSTTLRQLGKVEFYDSLPHDIDKVSPLIESTWRDWNKGDDKEGTAAQFYERRRNGQPASDAVYVGLQRPELLPPDWDSSRRNFVIFNSSEDEFFSIGQSFDKYKLFEDQIEGVRHLARATQNDPTIHYYLRIHPNLAPISYSYHTELAALDTEFSNLTVIPADSAISTYALIDASEKVFVFGSTAGVEATFWGKPVVLMGGAMYLHLDVAYYPATLAELDQLIVATLPPKPRIGALKYALYLFGDRGTPHKHVNFNFRSITIGKKTLHVPGCYEFRGSILPYASVAATFRLLNGLSHLRFKLFTMKQLSAELPMPAVPSPVPASR
jgi:hypothetical protein